MVFGLVLPDQETDASITWVHYGNNVANIPSRRVDSARYYNPTCTVVRYQDDQGNLHLGYADLNYPNQPEKPGDAWFAPVWIEGELTVSQWPDYEIMSVSPFCTLAWVPYTAEDVLPRGAVEGGYLIGEGPTYSISVYRAGALKFGEYAAGHSVAYYYYNGVKTATEFDILVRI